MDFRQARAGEYGGMLGPSLGVIPIPPYPSYTAYPNNYARDGNGGFFRVDPSKNANAAMLDAYGRKLWNDAHTADAAFGSDLTPPKPGTPRFELWFDWNGRANSVGVPLPFPQFPDVFTWWPAYAPNATPQDVAPGEFGTPDPCDEYRINGLRDISIVNQKWAAIPEGVVVSAGMTKQNMRDNIMLSYNAEATSRGCSTIPFPEAVGKTMTAESYPVGPSAPPTPVNTFTPNDGGPTVILDPDGSNVPPYMPPPPPHVIPTGDTPPTPWTAGGPDDGIRPLEATPPITVAPKPSLSLALMAGIGAAIYLVTRKRR